MVETVKEIAESQYVWAICCIIIVFFVIRELRKDSTKRENDIIALYETQKEESKSSFDEYRKETKEREDKLMKHLERSNESQERTAIALQSIEGRMDRVEKIIYRREDVV